MKKSDFIGKYFFRFGDIMPEELTEQIYKQYGFTIRFCESLNEKGLLFDSIEKALSASKNATTLIRGINDGTYVREEDIAEAPRKPRIYISGPISGRALVDCIPVFKKVEQELIQKGYRVFNPFDNGLDQKEPTHRHMRRDLNILTNEDDPFDYIYMQRRWLHSSGCKIEFDAATASGISVMFEEPDGNVHVIKFE